MVLALAGAAVAGYVKGGNDHAAHDAEIQLAQAEARDEAMRAAAAEIAKIDVRQVTIQGKVIERIRTEQVYTDCAHSPESWALIQEVYK